MNATQSRWNRPLVWIVGGLLLAVAGCIAIPLGDPEKSKVDDKLAGIWISHAEDNGDQTMFAATAYDARTYFVSEFDFSKEKGTKDVKAKDRMDWKMWLTDVGGQQFATLEMITPRLLLNSGDEDNSEKYAIVKLHLDGDKLTVQGVSDDFVKAADIKNSQQLQELIAKNLNNPKLFSDDSLELTRVKNDQTNDASAVLDAFGQGEGIK